ncbi:hypothetical protein, partial [Nocardiopsis sp. ATB16-24]|uniref:TPR repeat region-containing protein n=1 Tax=Nocardiopsis sp. ATB16-24 TaxID=3019555 RepID=UPI0025526FC8
MAFLDAFYERLESENTPGPGVLGVPAQMEGEHLTDEEREYALGVLGDGLLALSDPSLGGGYEDLPASVRKAAEGPFLQEPGGEEMPYHLVVYQEDARALSDLLKHTDPELQGGYALSTNLSLSSGAYLHYWGSEGDDGWLTSEEIAPLVDVGTRNKDTNYFMLTGTHLDPELGIEYAEHERTNAVEGLFTYEWHDEGATARQLTDWLAEDLDSDDYQESSRAGRAFAGFMETVTDPEMYESLINTGVHVTEGENDYKDASFTHFNTELANSFADIFNAHIHSFAEGSVWEESGAPIEGIGNYDPDSRIVDIGPEERAIFMQYLMGNDESAADVVESVDIYQQIEAAAFLESGQEKSTARGAGTIQGLLEEALKRDSEDRSADLKETVDRNKQVTGFLVDEAGNLADKIPIIGKAISKGMGLASDSIVDAIVNGEFDVSPRHPTYTSTEYIEQNFRLEALDYVSQKYPEELNNVVRPDEFRTLMEGGVLTIERGGEVLTADDIDENFILDSSIELTIEKNIGNWNSSVRSGDGLNTMDDALGDIMYDIEIITSDERTKSGSERVEDFTGTFTGAYNDTNNFFERQRESRN